jgi:hypothetical protein
MTELQLCNMALRRISAEPLSSLETDTSKEAGLCRTFYGPARDAALEEHPWRFAIARQSLTASTITNLTAWEYVFQLPTDPACIRPLCLIDTLGSNVEGAFPFFVEGAYLYTNLDAPALKYIFRQTDVTLFSPLFCDALAWRLAAELIKPCEGSSPVDPWMMYRDVLLSAEAMDDHGKQQPYQEPQTWADARGT